MLRIGIGATSAYLLTTTGRKTGRPRTTAVILVEVEVEVEVEARRWLVSPYGNVGWVHNVRSRPEVSLRRGCTTQLLHAQETGAETAGPILQRYVRQAPVARFGDGFLCAAAPSSAAGLIATVDRQWSDAGRPGRPRHVAQVNVAVGPEALAEAARSAIGAYYAFTGDPQRPISGLLTTPEAVRQAISAYGDLGVDEVILHCWATDTDQVDRLAALVA